MSLATYRLSTVRLNPTPGFLIVQEIKSSRSSSSVLTLLLVRHERPAQITEGFIPSPPKPIVADASVSPTLTLPCEATLDPSL